MPYDFRRPTKLSREHVRRLQVVYETFARRLSTVLTTTLRQVCQVGLREVVEQSYDDYVTSLPAPTLLLPVELAPLPGTATLEFSLPVALAAVDHMLGGPGGAQPVRPLTDIEVTLLRRLVEQMLGVLRYALEPLAAVQPTAGPIEYNPQFLQAASGSDLLIVSEFEITIGRESSPLTLSLPLTTMLPRLEAQRPHDVPPRGATQAAGALMRQTLNDMRVDVSMTFHPVQLDSARIVALAVGDVITLDHRVGAPLAIQAGRATVGHAVAGKAGRRLAALVVDSNPQALKENS